MILLFNMEYKSTKGFSFIVCTVLYLQKNIYFAFVLHLDDHGQFF